LGVGLGAGAKGDPVSPGGGRVNVDASRLQRDVLCTGNVQKVFAPGGQAGQALSLRDVGEQVVKQVVNHEGCAHAPAVLGRGGVAGQGGGAPDKLG